MIKLLLKLIKLDLYNIMLKNGNMPVLGHANPNTKITNSQKLITRSKPAQNQFPHLPYF